MKTDILGVKIDKLNMRQAVETVENWLSKSGRHYIVTPNVEFIMAALKDQEFRKILNNADLAIPDSARLGWAENMVKEKNIFLKLFKTSFFLVPKLFPVQSFDVITGTDLMEELIHLAANRGFTIGLLGGRTMVAEEARDCLLERYPKLKVVFADEGGKVDLSGEMKEIKIPTMDILFVAFGQVKQEKWIAKNLEKYPVKIMMGVGGALDYISGEVPRAPQIIRNLGFEWLFRLIVQPWRIKRFWALGDFVALVVSNN